MNKDTHLIFEAYKKKLIENAEGTLIPSDEEIQAAIEKSNSKCTVQEVKDAILEVIERYKPTDADDLKNGLYEDHQDISNNQIGVGKQRFPFKDHSVAEVAVRLANTKRMWNSMKERNARGENAEESSKLTMDVLIKAIEMALQPYRFECEVCYLGQVMDVLEKFGFNIWGNGADRDAFNNLWKEFVSKNAYCYDMNASDDPYEDREFTENKIEKNGPGAYLFMEGSGRGPDAYLAAEFASKHGYKKLILNGLS